MASSSSIDQFRLCRRKFKLARVDGWKQKAKKASLEIGKCLEAALQFYHTNGCKPGDFVDEWSRLWLKFSDVELAYSDQEGDWKTVYTIGVEWAKLYEITLPTLPIKNPKFQLNYEKLLWPGDPVYGELGYTAYVDMLSVAEDGSRLIIDIKTAKSMLDITPNMISLDGQLRKYAWVSGIRDVAFLNLVKAEPEGYKKGSRVTLLEDCASWKAGQQLVVTKFQAPKEAVEAAEGVKAAPATPWQMLVSTEETVQKMDEELDKISGKGAAEKKEQVLAKYVSDGLIGSVSRESVTKTRIQFVQGTIPEADIPEIGEQIGADVLNMHTSNQRGAFPKDGGVRFPNAICGWCEMNPICLGDEKKRDETLYQIKPKEAEKEKDWLSELEGDSE